MWSWWESADSVRTVNDWLQSIAVWFTAIAALAGIASLVTTRRLGTLEPPQSLLLSRVVSAESAADAAKAKAAAADERLTEAEKRTAAAEAERLRSREEQAARESQLQQEIARAKAETEKIRAGLAPRHLTAEHRQRFIAFLPLKADKGPVEVSAPIGDPEAITFSDELAALLKEAGWTVSTTSAVFASPPRGLLIVTSDIKAPSPIWLQKALREIGLSADGVHDVKQNDPPVRIVVGHKP